MEPNKLDNDNTPGGTGNNDPAKRLANLVNRGPGGPRGRKPGNPGGRGPGGPGNNNKGAAALKAIFPIAAMAGAAFLMYQMQKKMQGGANPKYKEVAKKGGVTFADVAGIDEALEQVSEVVEFLKRNKSDERKSLGGKVPKGILLVGPPGNGKTLLARAVAGEADVPFFQVSGSSFVEKYVGTGASRVRDLFEKAKKSAPCIIFIDELDAIGGKRGESQDGGSREYEQTLNEILVQMDGFEVDSGVIVMAATNRDDILDPALTRPGRFDRQVVVNKPGMEGREKILEVHFRNKTVAPNIDLRTIAKGTPGFSGADLANLANESALLAEKLKKSAIDMQDIEDAKDTVLFGPVRRSVKMSTAEKELTAYHEAGHAIVSAKLPASDPIHKATIIPRGKALGMVVSLPEGDQLSRNKAQLKALLATATAGRLAEEMLLGADKVTTGAQSDISQATNIAWAMVTEFGMSDKLGFVRYNGDFRNPNNPRNVAGEYLKIVNEEVQGLMKEAEGTARKILTDNEAEWKLLAQSLLKHGTLTGGEINKLLAGEKFTPEAATSKVDAGGSVPSLRPASPANPAP